MVVVVVGGLAQCYCLPSLPAQQTDRTACTNTDILITIIIKPGY